MRIKHVAECHLAQETKAENGLAVRVRMFVTYENVLNVRNEVDINPSFEISSSSRRETV